MCTDNPVRTRDYTEEFEHASRDIGYYTHIHTYIVPLNINYNICNIYMHIFIYLYKIYRI